MRGAAGCRCGRPLVFSDEPEHCAKCGRGPCTIVLYGKRPQRRRRLPDDLGALMREGRRPDPHLENVVRFDRLRQGPRLTLVLVDPEPEPVELTHSQGLMLSLAADGLSNAQIANALGTSVNNVRATLAQAYQRIGLHTGAADPNSPTRAAAVEWWRSVHEGRLAA